MLEGQIGAEGKHLRRGRATRWKAMEDRTDLVAGLQLHGQTMKGWIQSTMRRPDRSRTLSVYRFVPAFETFVLPFARNESGIRPLPAPVLVLSGDVRYEIEPHSHDFSSCVDPFARLIARLLSWMMCRWVRIDSEAGRKVDFFFSCWRSSFPRRRYLIWSSYEGTFASQR